MRSSQPIDVPGDLRLAIATAPLAQVPRGAKSEDAAVGSTVSRSAASYRAQGVMVGALLRGLVLFWGGPQIYERLRLVSLPLWTLTWGATYVCVCVYIYIYGRGGGGGGGGGIPPSPRGGGGGGGGICFYGVYG